MNLQQLLEHASRRRSVVVSVTLATVVVTFVVGLLLLSYETETTVLARPLATDAGSLAAGPGGPPLALQPSLGLVRITPPDQVGGFVAVLTSRSIVGEVVRRLELDRYYENRGALATAVELVKQPVRLLLYGSTPARERTPEDRAIEEVATGLEARVVPGSSIITIVARSEDAEQAAAIANTIVDVFVEHGREQNADAVSRAVADLEEQLARVRAAAEDQRHALDALKGEHDLPAFIDLAQETTRVSTRLGTAEDTLESVLERRPVLAQTLARIERDLAEYPEYQLFSSTTGSNSALENLRVRAVDIGVQLQRARFDYQENSPQVQSLTEQLELVETAIAEEVGRLLATETTQANPLIQTLLTQKMTTEADQALVPLLERQARARIAGHRERLATLAEVSTRAAKVETAIIALQQQEAALLASLDGLKVLRSRDLSEVEVLDRAVVPRYPVIRGLPLILYVLMGLATGLVAALGLAVWLDVRDAEAGQDDLEAEPRVPDDQQHLPPAP